MIASTERICFVAPNAYGAVTGTNDGHIGGIEHQTGLMARWLVARGLHVSVITWDNGQADGSEVDGVRMYKLCRRQDGLPGLRFLHPRWTSLRRALARADSDVYYYNCGDMGLGQLVLWCRRHGRKCVYSVANEPDCDPRLPVLRPLRERVLYRYGLRRADRIIVQTRRQGDMLRNGFGREAAVLPMPCAGPDERAYRPPRAPTDGRGRVLWVGRLSEAKRPDWLLELARRCPSIQFDVVGMANAPDAHVHALQARARSLLNVRLWGRVPHDAMPWFYHRAQLLCCTSSYEGFPNTFLEAWSHGLPLLTTFDPDGLVQAEHLGWVATSINELTGIARGVLADGDAWQRASHAARHYYLTHHQLHAAMRRFEQVIREVAHD